MFTFVQPTERRGKASSPMAVLGSRQPSSEPTGYCPIGVCITLVPEKQLVCREHVGVVPDDLMFAYWDTYQAGQPISPENAAAAAAIIEFGKTVAA